ncbi:MAG: PepSY domain-containing protein [Rhodanobacter sp.]
MALTRGVLKFLRTLHVYLGVFAAPALLFFAFTGGLQTFSLHETTRGSSYAPPAWLASAAHLHKKATLEVPVRRARPLVAGGARLPADGASNAAGMMQPVVAITPHTASMGATTPAVRAPGWLLALKIFFAVISGSLLISVLSGLIIAYRLSHRPYLLNMLVLAGVLLPLALLL